MYCFSSRFSLSVSPPPTLWTKTRQQLNTAGEDGAAVIITDVFMFFLVETRCFFYRELVMPEEETFLVATE